MVMPFSRSRSLLSRMSVPTCSCAAKTRDCLSMESTRVVLPWSTWAMIATLRRSARVVTVTAASYLRCGEGAARGRPLWSVTLRGLLTLGAFGEGRLQLHRVAAAAHREGHRVADVVLLDEAA